MGVFNRNMARVHADRRRWDRMSERSRVEREREIRRSVEAEALSGGGEKQGVSAGSVGSPVKGAEAMEYSKFVTQKELDTEVEAEIARREHIKKNMMDLPATYREKLPRRTQGIGGFTAAEQAVREQFRQDQEYTRMMESTNPVDAIARGLKQS